MLESFQTLLGNPAAVSLLVDLGLLALAVAFPASAGVVLTVRNIKRAALTQGHQAALAETAPLLDRLPIPNPEIKTMAVELGKEALAEALDRFERARPNLTQHQEG